MRSVLMSFNDLTYVMTHLIRQAIFSVVVLKLN